MAESYKWIILNETVKRLPDGAHIPNAPGNKDWDAFEAWRAIQGNTVVAADPPPSAQDILEDERAGSIDFILNNASPLAKGFRGLMLLIRDELNILRQRDRDRTVDVAASTSLADLKARWALRSSLTDRTNPQVRTAVEAIIDGGDAD